MRSILTHIKHKLSVISVVLICLTVTEVHLNLMRHVNKAVIVWDIVGYYGYLPATFIEKDLRLSFITPQNEGNYLGIKYGYTTDAQGHHVMKYAMGVAVLYAPFFFVAHTLAAPLGYAADGYSPIYHLAIEYSGLFYLFVGLIFLRRLLRMYYTEAITAACLAILFFGTNLLCYATIDGAMSHVYTFSLYAILLYGVVQYYRSSKFKYLVWLAILSGLIILVRPVNVLLLLAIPLTGICCGQDLRARILFFRNHSIHVLLYVLLTAVVVSPQLLYWKYVTGHFLAFSYGRERFYFDQPHLVDCLLGFRKGWLIYSPVLFFALAGVYYMRRQASRGFYTLHLVLLPVYFYMVASWWCWWYGGSFGLRPMIDLYPILALPLAACITRITQAARTWQISLFGILALLVALNIYQTFQYKYNIIHYDGMTLRSYLNVFGKMSKSETDPSLVRPPDYEKAVKGLGD